MRNISQAGQAALSAGNIAARNLVLFELASGNYGFWDDVHDLGWSGDTYLGRAGAFTITPLPSVSDGSVQGVDIVFSGLDERAQAIISGEQWHQKPVSIARALLDPKNGAVITVDVWYRGFIDAAIWSGDFVGGAGVLTVKTESISRELYRKSARTRSDADQRRIDASDSFFEHATAAVTQDIYWGRHGPQRAG